jgi:hypothetical protein
MDDIQEQSSFSASGAAALVLRSKVDLITTVMLRPSSREARFLQCRSVEIPPQDSAGMLALFVELLHGFNYFGNRSLWLSRHEKSWDK